MRKEAWYFLPFAFLFTYCFSGQGSDYSSAVQTQEVVNEKSGNWEKINPAGKTIESRLAAPPGFQRIKADANSVGAYLRNLPLKPTDSPVLLYDGSEKTNQQAQIAVVDMEIGKKDLQQCADAVMRLRAEYLFKQKQFDKIHFNFTSGDRADYLKYAAGYRAVIDGNKVSWQKKAAPSNSYQTFRKYLDLVFTYAGSASLEKELQFVKDLKTIQPGDVLIQGGHPGHAVMVVDVAENLKTGKRVYLLAQSYMPAQEIHLLKNPADEHLSPWYSADISGEINTPEWTFYSSQLKRFSTW